MKRKGTVMKYLVIGAGGVGGAITAMFSRAKKDISLIARNENLEKIKTSGLHFVSELFGNSTEKIRVFSQDEYNEKPDVIFVCTKYYSLNSIVPFLEKISDKNTIIIPILNGLTAGRELQKKLPETTVLDGCIYIVAFKSNLGEITHKSKYFKLVFGKRKNQSANDKILKQIEKDINDTGINGIFSNNIEKDAFEKFMLISPYAASQIFYDKELGAMQKEGEERTTLLNLMKELKSLAKAMNIYVCDDIIEKNMKIIDNMLPTTIASCYRDVKNNHPAEVESLIFNVVKLGKEYKVETPTYEKIALSRKEYRN